MFTSTDELIQEYRVYNASRRTDRWTDVVEEESEPRTFLFYTGTAHGAQGIMVLNTFRLSKPATPHSQCYFDKRRKIHSRRPIKRSHDHHRLTRMSAINVLPTSRAVSSGNVW